MRRRPGAGLDRPFPVQYLDWLWRALQGDFGLSYATRRPVLPSTAIPRTSRSCQPSRCAAAQAPSGRLSARLTASDAALADARSMLGLDRPFPVQYLDWLWRALQGDFRPAASRRRGARHRAASAGSGRCGRGRSAASAARSRALSGRVLAALHEAAVYLPISSAVAIEVHRPTVTGVVASIVGLSGRPFCAW
jgi:hypothetical protein